MVEHQTHASHNHVHGPTCGHAGIRHGDHVDYLHDGHLHRAHDGHVDECSIAVDARNVGTCLSAQSGVGHESTHHHSAGCGHAAIPHGDHNDYMVGDHLHHPHNGHCDDHGLVEVATTGKATH